MKIKHHLIPCMTIEEFAEANDLTMCVRERPTHIGSEDRYYASFENCEIKDGCCLISGYGNGRTPEEAIAAYAPEIALKLIVVDARGPSRKEITVPRLTPNASGQTPPASGGSLDRLVGNSGVGHD